MSSFEASKDNYSFEAAFHSCVRLDFRLAELGSSGELRGPGAMEELAAEVLNRLLGSATSIQTVRGDGEPVTNLILRQKSPLSLSLPSFYSFFLLGAPMKRE